MNEQSEIVGMLGTVLLGLAGAGAVVAVGGLGVYLMLRARRKRPSFQRIAAGRIECSTGPLRGQEFALGQGVSIGRDATRATIVVDDRQVSGQHVWVGPVDGRIIARDYGSTNGTFLNGDLVNRVTELALRDGDVLTLGQGAVKFTFRKP